VADVERSSNKRTAAPTTPESSPAPPAPPAPLVVESLASVEAPDWPPAFPASPAAPVPVLVPIFWLPPAPVDAPLGRHWLLTQSCCSGQSDWRTHSQTCASGPQVMAS